MAFDFLNDFLPGGMFAQQADEGMKGAEKGTVRNLVMRLAGILDPTAAVAGGEGVNPTAGAPMGSNVVQGMSSVAPGSVGDPQAIDLEPYQKAFLNSVSTGESNGRYDVRYTPAGGARFSDFTQHPGIFEKGPEGPSSAAGRYQFTKTTWDSLGGGSFDPVTQDIRGWQLAERDYRSRTGRDLSDDLQKKGFNPEIAKALSDTWTSFRNPDTVRKAQAVYDQSIQKYGANKVAGDVVTLPGVPNVGTHIGPTPQSADYAWGVKKQPGVESIGKGTLTDWMARVGERLRSGGPSGISAPIPGRPGVGPNAPGLGGPKMPPLTMAPETTPEQHKAFVSLVESSPMAEQIGNALQDRWVLNPQTWEREQNQQAFPAPFDKQMSPEALREYGMEKLKQEMLKRLGVDVSTGRPYNDQPTDQQQKRTGNTEFRLKELEADMEHRLRTNRPPKEPPYKNADRDRT